MDPLLRQNGPGERLFAPPRADAEKVEQRLAALPDWADRLIRQAGEALDADRPDLADGPLAQALSTLPDQPDVRRLAGLLLARLGHLRAAAENFEMALRGAPDDALIYHHYAHSLEAGGDIEGAWRICQRAVQAAPDSALAWYDYGEHCFQYRDPAEALEPLQRAASLDPRYAPARLKAGNALIYCGRIEEGAAEYRTVLSIVPDFGAAWYSLANIKTVRFEPAEISRMRGLLQGAELREADRTCIEFALAKACEDDGAYAEAFRLLSDSNARHRRKTNWSAADFSREVRTADEVFGRPHAVCPDAGQGGEVIFIVGLPRSGTTLIEQILSAHSSVNGANELGDLGRVLTDESAQRGQRYPDWVPLAAADDWQRLGRRYLELTARWRTRKPVFTDKMPGNWLFIGAIRSMLPAARIVVSRREPLENCWSCFKQFFFSGWDFSFDLADIAAYWRDFDRSVKTWVGREPAHIREQSYEALLADPEKEIRALLDFCGLPFESACLRFHESGRTVRTASAAQVRQPLQRNTARASNYGALLDPLRQALRT